MSASVHMELGSLMWPIKFEAVFKGKKLALAILQLYQER